MAMLPKTRGAKVGVCNICGNHGELTEDHTPPKGCIKVGQVVVHHITEELNLEKPQSKGRLLNNGVKYRTLCSNCNNTLLGTEYDPSFIEFVNQIASYLKTTLHLPPTLSVRVNPQRVMRSLVGHLCAQGLERYNKGALTVAISEYFSNPSNNLPNSINIYFWLYPYQGHVMARDCAYMDTTIGDNVAIWFLKFFPVGFLITFNEPDTYNFNLYSLSQWRSETIDFESEITINLRDFHPQHWPELPSNNTVLLYGNDAIVSYDMKKLKANKSLNSDAPR